MLSHVKDLTLKLYLKLCSGIQEIEKNDEWDALRFQAEKFESKYAKS